MRHFLQPPLLIISFESMTSLVIVSKIESSPFLRKLNLYLPLLLVWHEGITLSGCSCNTVGYHDYGRLHQRVQLLSSWNFLLVYLRLKFLLHCLAYLQLLSMLNMHIKHLFDYLNLHLSSALCNLKIHLRELKNIHKLCILLL